MTEYTVAQGRTLVMRANWWQYEGGPAANVTGVTIEIKPLAGGASVIGPTAVGVTNPATGVNGYPWAVGASQAATAYVGIWRGTDPQGDAVQATDGITVIVYTPVPGAYATVEELTAWITPVATPAAAAQLLVRASRDVDRALLTSVYDVDDTDVQTALMQATLEQAAGQIAAGASGGIGASTAAKFSLGKLSVDRSAGGTNSAAQARKVGGLWEQAFTILQLAGLTGQGPMGW